MPGPDRGANLDAAKAAWRAATEGQGFGLRADDAGRLFALTQALIEAFEAELEALRRDLDRAAGLHVLYVTDAGLTQAALDSMDEAEGTILRATDSPRALVMEQGCWVALDPK